MDVNETSEPGGHTVSMPEAPRSSRPIRSWILAGLAVGLTCGAVIGALEPLLRMWGEREFMTRRLWLDALSFGVLSHVVMWVAVGALACLFAAVLAKIVGRPQRVGPASVGLAAFLVGLPIVVFWGEAAQKQMAFARGPLGVATSLVAFGILLLPVAWLCSRIGRLGLAAVGRWALRIGVIPAIVLALLSVGHQWRSRGWVQSPDGFWSASAGQPSSRPQRSLPDIVLIVFDTLRADRLGCYGYGRPTSPHIDQVASDGVLFERAVSPGIWTEPSHASIFTGLYRSQHGVGWNRVWLHDEFHTLAELLRERGYQTIALSNNPNVSPGTNLTQGFDTFLEPAVLSFVTRGSLWSYFKEAVADGGALGSILGRWFLYDAGGGPTTDVVRQCLDRRQEDRPLLLFINYMEPHLPYEPTRAYRKAFVEDEDMAYSYRVDMDLESVHGYNLIDKSTYSKRDLRVLSDLYDARVRELDDHFASMMRLLRDRLDLDNTILVMTADHGESIGDHQIVGHQYCIYQTLIHVPLIVRWPRVLDPQRADSLVQTHDLFPTILSWVGIQEKQNGKVMVQNLATAVEGKSDSVYRNVFSEFLYPPHWAFTIAKGLDPAFDPSPWMVAYKAIFDQDHKLIVRSDQKNELYDLSEDPDETQNRIQSNSLTASRLHRQLQRWRASFDGFDPNQFAAPAESQLDDEQRRRLRNLGYIQ